VVASDAEYRLATTNPRDLEELAATATLGALRRRPERDRAGEPVSLAAALAPGGAMA
jgi:hypothetical protein